MGRKPARIPPIAVKRALRELGNNLRDARRRRRIPMALMGERAGITRATLAKAEKGDAGVSLGVYASVLFVLGMVERLAELASLRHDDGPGGTGYCQCQEPAIFSVPSFHPKASTQVL